MLINLKKKILNFSNLFKKKDLIEKIHRRKGRNNSGKITIRHRGGGHKKLYRKIDFLRKIYDIHAKVINIEYDPFRTAYIALICYATGKYKYILCSNLLKIGELIVSSKKKFVNGQGNSFPLKLIPIGNELHNIELYPDKGAQFVRSAGTFAKLISKNKGYVLVQLPSKELRLFNENCSATIGRLSNSKNYLKKNLKAGNTRWLGFRPKVRGSAMNPIDHPHGGGEGKSPIGKKYPVTPWGKHALGFRTSKYKKYNKYIVTKSYDNK